MSDRVYDTRGRKKAPAAIPAEPLLAPAEEIESEESSKDQESEEPKSKPKARAHRGN